jgi:hypothetical protein
MKDSEVPSEASSPPITNIRLFKHENFFIFLYFSDWNGRALMCMVWKSQCTATRSRWRKSTAVLWTTQLILEVR